MATLSALEIGRIKEAHPHWSAQPKLPFAQLEKIQTGAIATLIDNFPGHATPDKEGERMLRLDEADVRKLADEAKQAGTFSYTEWSSDVAEAVLGNLVCAWDRPGSGTKPKRFYIMEDMLEAHLDRLDPAAVKPLNHYNDPLVTPEQLQELVAKAPVVNGTYGHQKGTFYVVTEEQLAKLPAPRGRDTYLFGLGSSDSTAPVTAEEKLGTLGAACDGEKGKRRFYLPQNSVKYLIGSKPLTFNEIKELQRTRDTGVSGGTPQPGFKEFTHSRLNALLGSEWQTRMVGLYSDAPGTGSDNVAAVHMDALAERMREMDRASRTGGGGGRYGGRSGGGGSGRGGW